MEKRTIDLPDEDAAFIDQLVEKGEFASASEVIRAGLQELRAHESAIEQWLTDKVLPTARELDEHPERAIPADRFFDELYKEIAARTRNTA